MVMTVLVTAIHGLGRKQGVDARDTPRALRPGGPRDDVNLHGRDKL